MPDKRTSLWVTGNTGIPNQPESFLKVVRDAGTVTYEMEPDSSEWFQFSIPTPTLVFNDPAFLDRAWVLYRLFGGLKIDRVDFWDGERPIAQNVVNFTGDRGGELDDSTSPGGVPVGNLVNFTGFWEFAFAFNISVRVQSATGGDASFVAVGADFWIGTP